jgi:cobaltochelatase CobS
VRRVNLFGDIRSADLLGEKTLEAIDGESVVVWRDGPVAEAKRRGYWLLLDEMDACPPNIAFVLQALLEPGNPLVLAANNGEVVEQEVDGPGLRIFATANTLGRGDSTGIYAGTNLLNEAFLDRWLVHAVSYLSADAEVAVLVRAGLPNAFAKKLREAAELVRAGFDKGETTATLSTRRLVAWARLSAAFSTSTPWLAPGGALRVGYQLALENKLPAEERRFFGGVMQRVLGWPHG